MVFLTFVFLFTLSLAAQTTPCPGMNFYAARQAALFDSAKDHVVGMAQMMPGSFTGGQFPFYSPFQLQQFFLNFHKTVLGCVPGPPGIGSQAISGAIQPVPGGASQVVAASKLADGRPILVYVSPVFGIDGYAQV